MIKGVGILLVAAGLVFPAQAYADWGFSYNQGHDRGWSSHDRFSHGRSHHGGLHHSYPAYGHVTRGLPTSYVSLSFGEPRHYYIENIFTVNIPNCHGRYVPVVIKKLNNGFLGPQGEFYSEFPRVEQLRLMYGQ